MTSKCKSKSTLYYQKGEALLSIQSNHKWYNANCKGRGKQNCYRWLVLNITFFFLGKCKTKSCESSRTNTFWQNEEGMKMDGKTYKISSRYFEMYNYNHYSIIIISPLFGLKKEKGTIFRTRSLKVNFKQKNLKLQNYAQTSRQIYGVSN